MCAMKKCVVLAVLFVASLAHAATDKLSITKAGPVGELAQLSEANEVRVIFSEPMVALGRIPKVLTIPWFHISPAADGKFRWSGTTTLIFTPSKTLPFATKYDVTVDADAAAVSKHTLGKAYHFSFTTPTIQLKVVDWYRKGGKVDDVVFIALRFNQPVDAATIGAHLTAHYSPHELTEVDIPALARLTAAERAAFEAKVAKARQAAAADSAVPLAAATDWDKKHWPAAPEQVVFQTTAAVPPESHVDVMLDGELAKTPSSVRTGKQQQYSISVEPAFFVKSIRCVEKCDPDMSNRVELISREGVSFAAVRKAVSIVDITNPAKEVKLHQEKPKEEWDAPNRNVAFDELGYTIAPAHTYLIRIDPSLMDESGQALGYTWEAVAEYWHKSAFSSFGDGHGVWETGGGPLLPFSARNIKNVQQWVSPLSLEQLVPTMLELEKASFAAAPPVKPQERKLAPVADKIQAYGVDVSAAAPNGKGLVWVAVRDGDPIAKAEIYGGAEVTTRSTLVQVTNLGLSVKDSPQNTLVFVTRLDTAAPVAGAKVSIRNAENQVIWTGTTDEKGIAVAPSTPGLRTLAKGETPQLQRQARAEFEDEPIDSWQALDSVRFVATAEKDGDTAYAVSNWSDGIKPWDFGLNFDLAEAQPLLRGTVFADRGVYKPGEEVHLKAILRSDTPAGVQLLGPSTSVTIVVRDSHDKEVDRRTLTTNEWSTSEWTWKVPAEGALGTYRVMGRIAGQRLRVYGDFLVAAYRRPEFRVDVKMTAPSSVAGTKIDGVVSGRYLFGGAMSKLPVRWTFTRTPLWDVPRAISERFTEDQYTFLGEDEENARGQTTLSEKEAKLDAKGDLALKLDTDVAAGWPWSYELQGDVTDITRQKIAGRNSVRIDPAPWYIGLKTPPYFAEAGKGIDTGVVAAAIDGSASAGVSVVVELHRIQWNSVRHSEGNGFYSWETERKEVPSGQWTVVTTDGPQAAPLHVPIAEGGEYLLVATAKDAAGHATTTRAWFYASGGGYSAWARYDHNRIDLVPEKKTWKPGDTARILIKSPWEHATALLTTEREGVRMWRQFELTSTQQTVTVPITESDIPNVFVSVLLLKGRTKESGGNDETDPGKPSFRVGYVELDVEDVGKKLQVDVKADRTEYRPASKANVEVNVRDVKGAGAKSEVTLWAVDYGVLSLTGYKTPQVLDSIYIKKALQVATDESRQKVISRRVLTPKGSTDGGGGGRDTGPGMMRKDFRVLAFWLGSLVTDKNGKARTTVTLPESLTTYRIMAVAGDKASRFGWAQNEIRINKPLMITPAFPRFLALGDTAFFGSAVRSQLKTGGQATVTVKSLDPSIIEITGDPKQSVDVGPEASVEVRFNAVAKSVGEVRIQMSVAMNGETDAYEEVLPVRLLLPLDTVAAYGEANPQAKETLEVPKDAIMTMGGLHVELSSTAMVGLSEGAEYLVTYPYGCAEQRSSAAMALMLAGDLGEAFKLPGIDAPHVKTIAQATIKELYKFQCDDGGFSLWAGECPASTSPYLTAHVLHVMQRGKKLGYEVDKDVLERGYKRLEAALAEKKPDNEAYFPWYTAYQAFAVKVLAEGGHDEDSHINRLYEYADRMSLFGVAYLTDALLAKNDHGPRYVELHRRLTNAIAPEAGEAHVEELKDDYLAWLWSSNARSTAITLDTLVRGGEDEALVKQMVRWLMHARKHGRWGNTQENSWAMESLVDYYKKYESETPDFTAIVTAGPTSIAKDTFHGRSTEAKSHDVPMAQLPTASVPVLFDKQGPGVLFYLMRLRYTAPSLMNEPREQGIIVTRHYALDGTKTPATSFKAGDLIKVSLTIRNTKERRFVAITDPIPAGTEPVESWFATTASDLADAQRKNEENASGGWMWWESGGFDHVERHDDRVDLFATRLAEGTHEFSYLVRATTAGKFTAAPLRAEEMYTPEVFGRTASDVVEVKP
jgi:alpha-2-macroglobulin